MKKIIFLLSFVGMIFFFANTNAQNTVESKAQLTVDDNSSEDNAHPKFPGGEEKLKEYIAKNLRYPVSARENKIEGTVYISAIVEVDGTLSNIKIVQDLGHGCGEAAQNLVKDMPKWKPGKRDGKPARMGVNLPIKFVLE